MGTSSIFYGPKDSQQGLLPYDFQSDDNSGNIKDLDTDNTVNQGSETDKPSVTIPQTTIPWATVKSNLSKFSSSYNSIGNSSKNDRIKKIVGQHVKASGGAGRLASRLSTGISSGNKLFDFLSGLSTSGYQRTFENLQISLKGKSQKEVFSQLVKELSGPSNTKDDIVSSKAMQAALSEIYDYLERNEMDFEALDNMTEELVAQCMEAYITELVWGTLLNDLGCRIEKYAEDAKSAEAIESEFKEYISNTVTVEFKKNYNNSNPHKFVSTIITKCYENMELFI